MSVCSGMSAATLACGGETEMLQFPCRRSYHRPCMYIGALLTVFALAVGFALPSCADARPDDPFANHTVELNNEAPLFAIWEFLRDRVMLDKREFLSCMEQSNSSCPEVSALMKIVQEARQNQGKALLGHLNRSINLTIKAAPGEWTGPLDVLKMKEGDCLILSPNMPQFERPDSPQTTSGA
jgi:hypothetical protein